MNIRIPKYRIGECVWFEEQGSLLNGPVDMITMALKKNDEISIWYSIQIMNKYVTMLETDIFEDVKIPQPKFRCGESVVYEETLKGGEVVYHTDIISKVTIGIYDKDTIEIHYDMEGRDEEDYWVLEDEIIDFAKSTEEEVEDDVGTGTPV